jgi:hypothetical protein
VSRNHKDSINAHFYDKRLQFKTGLKKLKKSTFRAAPKDGSALSKKHPKIFVCEHFFLPWK